MAYQVEHAIDIDAPAAVVWGVIQNPVLRVRWHARVRSARAVDDRPPGPGHRVEVVLNLGCVPIRSVMEYVVWAPLTKSAVRSIGRDVFRRRTAGSWHFREDSRGWTTWTTRLSFSASVPVFGPVVERLFGRYFERLTLQSQRNLKQLIEGEYWPAADDVAGIDRLPDALAWR